MAHAPLTLYMVDYTCLSEDLTTTMSRELYIPSLAIIARTKTFDPMEKLHIVMFPWLAFGHMLPYLELSKSLARRGHHISFISTSRNIMRLPKVSPQTYHLIDFIPLDLPRVEGLPENAEATSDVLPEEVPYLKRAFDGLDKSFSKFIRESTCKVDWVVHDFSHHWMPQIAAEADVPCIVFFIFAASSLVFTGPLLELSNEASRRTPEQFTVLPPWIPYPSKLAFRLHEAKKLLDHFSISNTSGVSDHYRIKQTVAGCRAVIIRSCMEIESDGLSLLQDLYRKPVRPIGLLPPPTMEESSGNEEKMIINWLNKQRSRSVIYVAFGSEAMLSVELMHEVALGLELSSLPFLWALRRPVGLLDKIEMLPEDFEERTKGHGVVAKAWVPQLKILAHDSVGGFLTHAGWGSVVESLHFGQPLVLLPISLDQGLNARAMEDKGIGIEVERDEETGSFAREAVAMAARLVMVEQEGEPYRRKAKELKDIFSDKDYQEKYVDDFVQFLHNH